MIYNLVLSEASIQDIEQASAWYEKQQVGLGSELVLCLEESLLLLLEDPLKYQKKHKDVRVKYIKRFPYGIHYQIESSKIKVIAVFHMKQNPVRWEKRTSLS